MNLEITKSEAWRILDAVEAYKNDYELSVSVQKNLKDIIRKMKKVVNQS